MSFLKSYIHIVDSQKLKKQTAEFDMDKFDLRLKTNHLPESKKLEMTLEMLRSLQAPSILTVAKEAQSLLMRDIIGELPFELAVRIMSKTDHCTLGRCSVVSKKWNTRCSDTVLWKTIYFNNPGWSVNERFLNYLARPTYRDDHLLPKWTLATTRQAKKTSKTISISEIGYGSLPRDYFHDLRSVSPDISEPTIMPTKSGYPLHDIYIPDENKSLTQNTLRDSSDSSSKIFAHLQENTNKNPVAFKEQYNNLSWKNIYRQRLELSNNWLNGNYKSRIFNGHTEAVYCIQFDSHKIVSGSRDDTIKLWDIKTGKCIGSIHIYN